MADEALITREQRGSVAVLTMAYKPYNLIRPALMNALVTELRSAHKPVDRDTQRPTSLLGWS